MQRYAARRLSGSLIFTGFGQIEAAATKRLTDRVARQAALRTSFFFGSFAIAWRGLPTDGGIQPGPACASRRRQTPAEFADAILADDRQLRPQQIRSAEPAGRLVEGQVILDQNGAGRLVQSASP